MPASPTLTKQFQVGDKVRVNLHHGKIEDAVVHAVIHDAAAIPAFDSRGARSGPSKERSAVPLGVAREVEGGCR